MAGFVERLRRGVLLGDGGYVLELERRGYVQAGPYTPEVAVEHPEALLQLHLEFKRAGAEVLQALTFYASEDKLAVTGRAADVAEINRSAVRIARQAAAGDALVAGVVTLTPTFVPGDAASGREVRRILERQIAWQMEAGVDLAIGETYVHLEEALIAAEVLCATGLPVVVTMNVGPDGSREGIAPAECAKRLEDAGADVVGVNCSHDPDALLPVAVAMRGAVTAPVACQPIGYRTSDRCCSFTELDSFPLALEPRQLTRFEMAEFAVRAEAAGVAFVGGCCGVGPYHVRAMAEALGRRPAASEKSPDLARHVLPHVRERALAGA